ncbi:MAG: DUF6036 family nucleotidyltransferase [Pseudohongiellaceae bacterium]
MFIERVCNKLSEHSVPFAIVGGHAVALHGAVRGTVDIDFVIVWSAQNLKNAERALIELGLSSRLPISAEEVFKNRINYISDRNLIAWNFYNPNSLDEQVDLIINYDLDQRKPKLLKSGEFTIPILAVNDLIAMKRESGRPQDLADVEALEKIIR